MASRRLSAGVYRLLIIISIILLASVFFAHKSGGREVSILDLQQFKKHFGISKSTNFLNGWVLEQIGSKGDSEIFLIFIQENVKMRLQVLIGNRNPQVQTYATTPSFSISFLSAGEGETSAEDDALMQSIVSVIAAKDPGGLSIDTRRSSASRAEGPGGVSEELQDYYVYVTEFDKPYLNLNIVVATFILLLLTVPYYCIFHFFRTFPERKRNVRVLAATVFLGVSVFVIWLYLKKAGMIIFDFSEFRGFVPVTDVRDILRIFTTPEIIKTPPLMRLLPQLFYFVTGDLNFLRAVSVSILVVLIPFVVFSRAGNFLSYPQKFFIIVFSILQPWVFQISVSMRGYAFLVFCSLAATVCFCRFLEKREAGSVKWMAFFLGLSAWTHYFSCFTAFCFFAVVLWESRKDDLQLRKVVLKATLVYGFCILPLVAAWGIVLKDWYGGWNVSDPVKPISFEYGYKMLVLFPALFLPWGRKYRPYIPLLATTALSLLFSDILSKHFIVYYRYLVGFVPPAVICISYIFRDIRGKRKILKVAFQAAVVFFIFVFARKNWLYPQDITGTVEFLKENRSRTNLITTYDVSYTDYLYYWLEDRFLEPECYTDSERVFIGCHPGNFGFMIDWPVNSIKELAEKKRQGVFYLDPIRNSKHIQQNYTDQYTELRTLCSKELDGNPLSIYYCSPEQLRKLESTD